MKRILKTISLIIVALVIFFGAVVVFSTIPFSGNYKILTVRSGSMEPEIKMGSLVLVKPIKNYKIGDIVTFETKTEDNKQLPTTHRIVEMRVERGNPVFITKGDANDSPDRREIHKRDIMGKVFLWIPYIGFLAEFAKSKWGLIVLVIIPTFMIVYDRLTVVFKEIRKIKERKKENV